MPHKVLIWSIWTLAIGYLVLYRINHRIDFILCVPGRMDKFVKARNFNHAADKVVKKFPNLSSFVLINTHSGYSREFWPCK